MDVESEIVQNLIGDYPHRSEKSVQTDVDADEILEGYLDHQDAGKYEFMESDFPFYAALGRTGDSRGQLVLTSHYTYPDDGGISQDNTRASLEVDNIDTALEENVIDEESILDASGAELTESKKVSTLKGGDLMPETVHCIVFYERPVVSASEGTEYESRLHEQSAMESLSEPSLATAMIQSGRDSKGEDFAVAQIDYWTRTVDGLEGGLDYTELNWENPGTV